MEQLLPRFRAAHTQVLGISVDSVYSHANWARDLGGISFPLLADFHPKGAVAAAYGLYLEDKGIDDRATVIIDASGRVRHASSVTPSGERNIEELAQLCQEVDEAFDGKLKDFPEPPGLGQPAEIWQPVQWQDEILVGALLGVRQGRGHAIAISRMDLDGVTAEVELVLDKPSPGQAASTWVRASPACTAPTMHSVKPCVPYPAW